MQSLYANFTIEVFPDGVVSCWVCMSGVPGRCMITSGLVGGRGCFGWWCFPVCLAGIGVCIEFIVSVGVSGVLFVDYGLFIRAVSQLHRVFVSRSMLVRIPVVGFGLRVCFGIFLGSDYLLFSSMLGLMS